MAPIDFGRPITTEDRSDFVLDVMISDQIGRIAIHHLVLADLRPAGTDDEDCKNLSMLHSAAVDFPKTGHKVRLPNSWGRLRTSLTQHIAA